MHNEETDLHKPLCFAINRSWLFKWFTRSSSDMYGDTLGNISSGLFSVERNGEIHGINLKPYCDLQYSYDVICQKMSARVSSGVPDTEKQMKARGRRPSAFIVSIISHYKKAITWGKIINS